MDGLSLLKIQKFINRYFIPCELNGIYEIDNTILFDIYKEKRSEIVFDLSRNIILFDQKTLKVKKLSFFHKRQMIVNLEQRGYDRIIEFTISSRKQSGKLETFYIVFEFVGGNANTFFLNEDRKIIYRLNDKNIDPDRDISIGKEYFYFKKNKMYTLDNFNNIKTFDELEGFYPKTARFIDKIVFEKGVDAAMSFLKNHLSDENLYVDSKGRFYPFPISDELKKVRINELSLPKHAENIEILRVKLLNFISKKIKKEEELLEKLKTNLLEANEYEKYRKKAEILKNNYAQIKNSKGVISLFDYTEEGINKIEIDVSDIADLDSEITYLYKKYKKLRRSIALLNERIEEVLNNILRLKEEEFNIENAEKDELVMIYNEYFSKSKNKNVKEVTEKIKKISYKGFEILIGKNSRTNQELVFHIANPDDIWMHAQKIPSAHVVIKNSYDEIPPDVITFAARVTAYFSKAKNDKKVNIDYTFRKFVKKPKKSKEGFVIYSNFKTVTVNPFTEDEIMKCLPL